MRSFSWNSEHHLKMVDSLYSALEPTGTLEPNLVCFWHLQYSYGIGKCWVGQIWLWCQEAAWAWVTASVVWARCGPNVRSRFNVDFQTWLILNLELLSEGVNLDLVSKQHCVRNKAHLFQFLLLYIIKTHKTYIWSSSWLSTVNRSMAYWGKFRAL